MYPSATTQAMLRAKAAKGLSWAALAEQLQATDVWIASCVYGENSMLPEMAQKLCRLLDLDEDAKTFLTTSPIKGNSLGEKTVPTDPLMYRFYEILCVYAFALTRPILGTQRTHVMEPLRREITYAPTITYLGGGAAGR
jgi:cyanate lyase